MNIFLTLSEGIKYTYIIKLLFLHIIYYNTLSRKKFNYMHTFVACHRRNSIAMRFYFGLNTSFNLKYFHIRFYKIQFQINILCNKFIIYNHTYNLLIWLQKIFNRNSKLRYMHANIHENNLESVQEYKYIMSFLEQERWESRRPSLKSKRKGLFWE